jgi:hypothetical protein
MCHRTPRGQYGFGDNRPAEAEIRIPAGRSKIDANVAKRRAKGKAGLGAKPARN